MTTEDTRFRMVCNISFFSFVIGAKWFVNRFASTMYKNLCKTLVAYFIVDMNGLSAVYIVHHLFALAGMMLILGSGLEEVRDVGLVNSMIDMEISTIFLNLYRLSKIDAVGYLFAVTFMYYRLFVFAKLIFLDYKMQQIDVFSICKENSVITDINGCAAYMNGMVYFYFGLNSYWFCLIIKKMFKKQIKSA